MIIDIIVQLLVQAYRLLTWRGVSYLYLQSSLNLIRGGTRVQVQMNSWFEPRLLIIYAHASGVIIKNCSKNK